MQCIQVAGVCVYVIASVQCCLVMVARYAQPFVSLLSFAFAWLTPYDIHIGSCLILGGALSWKSLISMGLGGRMRKDSSLTKILQEHQGCSHKPCQGSQNQGSCNQGSCKSGEEDEAGGKVGANARSKVRRKPVEVAKRPSSADASQPWGATSPVGVKTTGQVSRQRVPWHAQSTSVDRESIFLSDGTPLCCQHLFL